MPWGVAAAVAGAATSALLSDGGGGSSPAGSVTTTQNQTPFNANYLSGLYAAADKLNGSSPIRAYSGQTYFGPTMFQTQGNQMLGARGMAGSPVLRQGQQLAQDTLSGKYLDPGSNPWLQGAYDHAANALEGSSRSAWGGQDTLPGSSGIQQAALGNAQGNLASSMFGGAYQAERKNQLGTMAYAPSLAQADYNDINAVTQAGNQQQQLGQQGLNDQQARFEAEQMAPYRSLQAFQNFIGGPSAGTTTSTQPYFTNPTANLLGAGLGGLSLYNGINQAVGGPNSGGLGQSLYNWWNQPAPQGWTNPDNGFTYGGSTPTMMFGG